MIKKNVIGMIILNGKLALQLRDSKKNIIFPNSWGFFGGGINLNEKPIDAIKRELFEELNLKNFKSLRFINIYFSSKYKCIFYIYTLKLFEKIILKEGYDYDFFIPNKIHFGKISKKNNKFYNLAETILMKKIIFLAKRFF